jgi:hypothetical protein
VGLDTVFAGRATRDRLGLALLSCARASFTR